MVGWDRGAAATPGRAGRGIEGANATTAWLAGTGVKRRRVDFARPVRSLNFSIFFCPGLRPRHLAQLDSLAASGEGDTLLTSLRTGCCAGVELAVAWGEGGRRRGGLLSHHCCLGRAYLEIAYFGRARVLYLFFERLNLSGSFDTFDDSVPISTYLAVANVYSNAHTTKK